MREHVFTNGVLAYLKDKIKYLDEDAPKMVELASSITANFFLPEDADIEVPDQIETFIFEMRELAEMITFLAVYKVDLQTHSSVIDRIVSVDKAADNSRKSNMLADFARCMRDHPVLQDRWRTLVHESVKWSGKIEVLSTCARSVDALDKEADVGKCLSVLDTAYSYFETHVASLPDGICDELGDAFGAKLAQLAQTWLDPQSEKCLKTSGGLDRLQAVLQKALQVSPLQQQLDSHVQAIAAKLRNLGSEEKLTNDRLCLEPLTNLDAITLEALQKMQEHLKKHPDLHTFGQDFLDEVRGVADNIVAHVEGKVKGLTTWAGGPCHSLAIAQLELAAKLFTAITDPKTSLKTAQPGLLYCNAVKAICTLLVVHDRVKPQADQTVADIVKLDLVSLSKLTDLSRACKKCIADRAIHLKATPTASTTEPEIIQRATETGTEMSALSYKSWLEMLHPELDALKAIVLIAAKGEGASEEDDKPWWETFAGSWQELVKTASGLLQTSLPLIEEKVIKLQEFADKLHTLAGLMIGKHENKEGAEMVEKSLKYGNAAVGLHKLLTCFIDPKLVGKDRRATAKQVVAAFKAAKIEMKSIPEILQTNIRLAMRGEKLEVD